jgi:hypothetical protein
VHRKSDPSVLQVTIESQDNACETPRPRDPETSLDPQFSNRTFTEKEGAIHGTSTADPPAVVNGFCSEGCPSARLVRQLEI